MGIYMFFALSLYSRLSLSRTRGNLLKISLELKVRKQNKKNKISCHMINNKLRLTVQLALHTRRFKQNRNLSLCSEPFRGSFVFVSPFSMICRMISHFISKVLFANFPFTDEITVLLSFIRRKTAYSL